MPGLSRTERHILQDDGTGEGAWQDNYHVYMSRISGKAKDVLLDAMVLVSNSGRWPEVAREMESLAEYVCDLEAVCAAFKACVSRTVPEPGEGENAHRDELGRTGR
jgi:hypothetical protein